MVDYLIPFLNLCKHSGFSIMSTEDVNKLLDNILKFYDEHAASAPHLQDNHAKVFMSKIEVVSM